MYTGAVQAEERWRARRAEARQAFMQFMEMYPNASAEDYRRYAFEVSEGNSYLRGGLPTDQIMERLAQDRQAEYMQKRMMSNMQLLQAQAQLSGQLDALANTYALDTDDDNKLTEQIATALGYDPKDQNTAGILDQVKRQYPSGFQSIRQRQRDELFQKNLPMVEKLIEANPNLTDQELATLVPGLDPTVKGPRLNIMTEMLKGAREKDKERRETKRRELLDSAVSDAQKQIDATGEYSLPSLEGQDLAEAERRVKPYYEARKKLQKDAATEKSRSAVTEAASLYANDPMYLQSMAEDPNKVAAFKDFLRQSARTRGMEPDDNYINFVANSTLSKAKEALREKKLAADRAQLSDYKRDISQVLADPTAPISALPSVPTFADPELQAQAKDAYERSVQQWATRRRETNRKEDTSATFQTVDSLLKDELFVGQVVNGDIKANDITARVTDEMRSRLGRDPAPADVKTAIDRLAQRVDSVRSAQLVQQSAQLKEQVKKVSGEATENNKKALAALVAANVRSDTEGVEDPSAAALNVLVQSVLYGPDSSRVLTADGVAVLAPFMTRDFAEEHNNNPIEMYNEIMRQTGGKLEVSSQAEAERAVRLGFPYGDRRGSKKPIISDAPRQTIAKLDQIDQKIQESYAKLTSFMGQYRREQTRHPTASFNNSDTLAATQAFNNEINDLLLAAKQLTGATIQQIQGAAAKSQYWSTDGEITSEDLAKVRTELTDRLKATLARIEAVQKNGTNITVNLGVRPEDQLIGQSPRLQQSSTEEHMEDVGKRFSKSPVGKLIKNLTTNDHPLDENEPLSPEGGIDYNDLRQQFQQ
jgi:hypothetical protein